MKKLSFTNLSPAEVRLQFEPWAQLYPVAPAASVEIEYEDTEYDMEFALNEDGSAFISLYARKILVRSGGESQTFSTEIGFAPEL